ncbi:MAG: putative transposase [Pseudohongiellaceae bacterium]
MVDYIEQLRISVGKVKQTHAFTIDAMVVLPDHIHAIWTLPEFDSAYSKRWSLIKANFSRRLPVNETISASRNIKGERGIWQRIFWEHLIRDENDFNRHVEYIHINPVKHGYVGQCSDWPYSSFHRYVRQGLLPLDWAGKVEGAELLKGMGERIG